MLAVWIWPVCAATLIISDWYTMKSLRASGHTTILDAIRDENTASSYCYDRQGMYRASMMKGQSKMFADRIAEIPEGQDIWKY
uniref:N-acetyltransferase n=1 Tax=Elaeophora elaphi TaxID=1147741 RepID=A0A0R3RV95_9BILA